MALLADIAVPVPLAHAFTYRVPDGLAGEVCPGARVLCEFGRRKVLGIVIEVAEREPGLDEAKLKPIAAVLDAEPVFPPELMRFLRELASYYFAPIGEVMRLALPAVERDKLKALRRQGKLGIEEAPSRTQQVGRVVTFARATDRLEQPGTLRGQAAALLALLRATGEQQVARLADRYGNARPALKKLAAQGLVELFPGPAGRQPVLSTPAQRDVPPTLNQAQQHAVALIEQALPAAASDQAKREGFLLYGVTGSGKTEVYLQAIARCLSAGRGALVLVPEIALTPQLVGRFRARFGDEVALLHSGLAQADRHPMWQRLRQGELRVAIGARSALFAPVPQLGLVVVDEEHDGSFKQEDGVRYHARDMAILRAYRAGAVVVVGSATPSLEAVHLARTGKLTEIRLPERATAASMPDVVTVDLKGCGPGPSGSRLLSLPLHRAIERTLEAEEQAIIFLNRRGFAPSVICEACGVVVNCRSCSVALTYHRRGGGRLRCHYCDYSAPLAERCPECGGGPLGLEGLGTEKLEDTLATAFPTARVARLDRDVAAGVRSERILDRMRAGEVDILVGTQMVTKGHDLPRVTLVGVVNADAALSLPDFRAAERGFQLLVQVAGRAGRHDRPGRVLVQTRDPAHPAVRFAARHDVDGFVEQELVDRREVRYPPFSRLALLRVNAPSEQRAQQVAAKLAAHARSAPAVAEGLVQVLGPAPAPIAKLRTRFRFRVMLRARQRPPLRTVLQQLAQLQRGLRDRTVRIVIDVDPVSML